MIKIAFIGAGSYGFTYKLAADILSFDEMKNCTLAFMDVDAERLKAIETIIRKFVKTKGVKAKILFTKDRKKALEGADFVFNLVKIGFLEAAVKDLHIPKKYGLKQTVGDTCGTAGIFRGLRTLAFLLEMSRQMEKICPGTMILNYTNPQSILTLGMALASPIRFTGLCHSVQGTTREIAKYMDIPYDELVYKAGGINHMSWILKLEHKGKNIYPGFIEKVRKNGIYEKDKKLTTHLGPSRLDMLLRTGYMVTESSTHFPEYVPYYLRNAKLIRKYKIKIDAHIYNMERKEKAIKKVLDDALNDKLEIPERSVEYGPGIIHSMITDTKRLTYTNVLNRDLISNLPSESAVEVPCVVDRNGIQPVRVGELPTVLAALNRTNINVHQLAVKAILEKDRNSVVHAMMLDPLTSAQLNLDEIKSLADELISAHKKYLAPYL